MIHSERVVTPAGVIPARIHIEGGRILAVGPELLPPEGEHLEINAGRLVVMPGGVDVHTHMELTVAGVRTADDWASASQAALFGGTTTVLDFAEPDSAGSLVGGLSVATARMEAFSLVDAGFHVTVTPAAMGHMDELEALAEAGHTSLKIYTAYPGLMLQRDEIAMVLARAAHLGLRVWVHCEDWADIQARITATVAAGQTGAIYHARTRPPESEANAVKDVLELAEHAGAAVHLAHLSTARAVELLAEARERGLPVTAETCPQYLWLEERRLAWPAPAGLCNICAPPLRTAPHLEALWAGLAGGVIDTVATDHCPFFFQGGKDRGLTPDGEDFTRVPGGLAGVETRLPLVFSGGVSAGRFGLERFVHLVSASGARLAGLYPRKGALVAGADADLVFFDPASTTSLDSDRLHGQGDHSPYEGMRVRGRVAGVIKAGVLVVADDQWLEDPPLGRLLAGRDRAGNPGTAGAVRTDYRQAEPNEESTASAD